MEYMEWVLLHNGSPFTICESEEEVRAPATTTNPMTATPEPTANHGPEAVTIRGPRATDRPETKPTTSDQVCEPATSLVPVGLLVKHEGMLSSPTPSTMADDGALIDWKSEYFLPVSFPCTKSVSPSTILLESAFPPSPESPVSPLVPPSTKAVLLLKVPPRLPLLPSRPLSARSSALSLLFPFSSSAPPLSPLSSVESSWTFQSPATPWNEDPLARPQASEPWAPPLPSDPSAPPWLHWIPSVLGLQLRFHLGPHSLQLRPGLPSHFHLGPASLQLRLLWLRLSP